MEKTRRDFITTSAAWGVLSVSKASAAEQCVGTGSTSSPSNFTKTIGFVVSTRDHLNHQFSFLRALADYGWAPNISPATVNNRARFVWASADGRYGPSHDELHNLAKKHVLQDRVDMIVSAGGLMTAIAVSKALAAFAPPTFPFVYLIGRSPFSTEQDAAAFFHSPNKAGGVDQAIPDQNENSFQQMKNQSNNVVLANNVGLIINSNSPMSGPESASWIASGHDSRFVYSAPGVENDQQLPTIFAKIKIASPQPAGLIVSSDPYFRSIGPDFDTNLRAVGGGNFYGWVCYPYKEYQTQPQNNQSIKSDYTPDLATDDPADKNTAYYQLGKKTAAVLNYLACPPPGPPAKPDVGIKTWDGMQRKWLPPDS
jgi:hypothetical protein